MNIRNAFKIIHLFLIIQTCNAQDTIFFKNGTQAPARVIEIFSDSIRFKFAEKPDSVLSVLSCDSIISIKYANGKIEWFENNKSKNKIINIPDDPQAMYWRGRTDAGIFYKAHGAFWGTFAATSPLAATTGSVYAIPFLGFTVGATFGLTNPVKITVPDQSLLNNPDYMKGYIKEARKKRLANAAGGGALGLGADLVFVLILLSSLSNGH